MLKSHSQLRRYAIRDLAFSKGRWKKIQSNKSRRKGENISTLFLVSHILLLMKGERAKKELPELQDFNSAYKTLLKRPQSTPRVNIFGLLLRVSGLFNSSPTTIRSPQSGKGRNFGVARTDQERRNDNSAHGSATLVV